MTTITGTQLQTLNRSFSAAFNQSLIGEDPNVMLQFATRINMSTNVVEIAMAKNVPGMRLWEGDRHHHGVAAHGFYLRADKYELTIEIPREDVEDDNLGIHMARFGDLTRQVRQHPDDLLAALIEAGETGLAYDAVAFFSASHQENGASASNLLGSGSPPWYLLCNNGSGKPFLYGSRTAPELVSKTSPTDDNVFDRDAYVYGARVREGVQYGLWQAAVKSKAALDETNFNAAMEAMMARKDDTGRSLGLRPTHIMIPTSLYAEARALFAMPTTSSGGANPLYNEVQIIVNQRLALA